MVILSWLFSLPKQPVLIHHALHQTVWWRFLPWDWKMKKVPCIFSTMNTLYNFRQDNCKAFLPYVIGLSHVRSLIYSFARHKIGPSNISRTVLRITFVQYLIAFFSRPEATSNVISNTFVEPVIPNNNVWNLVILGQSVLEIHDCLTLLRTITTTQADGPYDNRAKRRLAASKLRIPWSKKKD